MEQENKTWLTNPCFFMNIIIIIIIIILFIYFNFYLIFYLLVVLFVFVHLCSCLFCLLLSVMSLRGTHFHTKSELASPLISVTQTTQVSVLQTTDNYDEPTVLDKHTMVSVTQTTHASYGLLIIMTNLL